MADTGHLEHPIQHTTTEKSNKNQKLQGFLKGTIQVSIT